MTGLDWAIVVFALLFALWGYRQGLIVALFTTLGFAGGALIGARFGPALLAEGSSSPYAPLTGLTGALLIGGVVAVVLEGVARTLRHRLGSSGPIVIADGAGGALLLGALALGLAWMGGVVALNAPQTEQLRESVQRSKILGALNDALPPSGFVLRALNRVDPRIEIRAPSPNVRPPDPKIVSDPDVDAAGDGVVRVVGTACGLGISGSGWVIAPGLVVTNAHVIAGEEDTAVSVGDGDGLDATPVHYDPANDIAMLRVADLDVPALKLVTHPKRGSSGAVLGYPENGPFNEEPARLGATGPVQSQDSYGRGPERRLLTGLRGLVRSGNSGGPMVDADGRVLTTVFAAITGGAEGGYGVPNQIVERALPQAVAEVGTGPCTP